MTDCFLVMATVLGPVVGAIIALLAAPVGHWLFGPKLRLDFRPDDGRCVVESPTSRSRWARISVINRGGIHLRQCQAFVTDLEQERSGKWGKTDPPFVDPLVLEWAALTDTKYKPRDLPKKIKFYINVVASSESSSGTDNLALTVQDWPPDRLKTLFTHGRYKISVTVTGDHVRPKHIKVIVNWTGHWQFETSRGQ
jgi:hypothetical protein